MGSKDKRAACVEAADDPDVMFFEGFDDAVIGWAERDGEPVAAYCSKRIVRILTRQGWKPNEAREHLANNVIGAWMGPRTPIVILPLRFANDRRRRARSRRGE